MVKSNKRKNTSVNQRSKIATYGVVLVIFIALLYFGFGGGGMSEITGKVAYGECGYKINNERLSGDKVGAVIKERYEDPICSSGKRACGALGMECLYTEYKSWYGSWVKHRGEKDCNYAATGYRSRAHTRGVCEEVAECDDECSPRESKTCADDRSYKVCDNYDDDPCLEYSGKNYCGSGKKCRGAGYCYVPSSGSHYEERCWGGDVYWYDIAGQREEKKEECGSAGCRNNQCVSAVADTGWKTGEWCGYKKGVETIRCEGENPEVKCPSGFTRKSAGLGGGKVWTCIKK